MFVKGCGLERKKTKRKEGFDILKSFLGKGLAYFFCPATISLEPVTSSEVRRWIDGCVLW